MSLINQTYPKDKYEIVIADGKSEDGTLDVVRKFQDKCIKEGLVITVVTNEKKILATGWNIAINAAKGEYVTRIDAHAEAEPDFVENSIKAILKVDAVCVGGKLTSLSLDGAENVISKVLSSPFGVGNSSFRVSSQACYADTAVYGLQNLTSFGVGYFTVNPFKGDGWFDEAFLNAQPAVEETEYLRHVRFDAPITIKMDGKKSLGVVLKP